MLDRIADWLDQQPPGRRRLYSLFLAIVLLTLPCYAAGFALWALDVPGASMLPFGPRETALPTATVTATAAIEEPDSPPPEAPPEDDDEDEPEATEPPPLATATDSLAPTSPAPIPSATSIVFPSIVPRLATETPQPSATALAPTAEPTATDAPPEEPSETPLPPAEPSETPIGQITLEPTG